MDLQQQHDHNNGYETWRTEMRAEMRAGFQNVNSRLDMVNGRLRKSEIAIAVLQFGVLTVGGALAYAGMQLVIAKLTGG